MNKSKGRIYPPYYTGTAIYDAKPDVYNQSGDKMDYFFNIFSIIVLLIRLA